MSHLIIEQDIVDNLRTRASIRRQIPGRKSVQEGKPDRIAELLEDAAAEIERLRDKVVSLTKEIMWLSNDGADQ